MMTNRDSQTLTAFDAGVAPTSDPRSLATDFRWFSISMAAVLVIFAAIHNQYWMPGGDTDFYLAAARSIAKGHGYWFNGQPVNIAPPLWPLLLAGAMKISTTFAFLKFVNLSLMTLFLALYFWIARRFVATPALTAAVIVGTALIAHVFQLTSWFHTDPLFSVTTAITLLAALRLREGRNWWPHVLLLALACAASVAVRAPGLFNGLLVAGLLLGGRAAAVAGRRRRFITLALIAVVMLGTFEGLRIAQKPTAAQLRQVAESGIILDETARSEAKAYDLNFKQILAEAPVRVACGGRWLAWLFWETFRMGAVGPVTVLGTCVGWFALLLLLIKAVGSARQGDWLWLGLAALCGVLILIWPDVNPRYLVPVAPLLAMAVLSPLITASGGKGALASWSRVLVWIFVISVAVTNLSLWGISVYVARHRDFYGLYEAGMDQDLIDIGYYLGRVGASNREIGVSGRYKNGPHIRHPRFLMRALVVLTENHVASIPVAAENDIRLPPGQSVLDWAHKSSVRYYACLPPVSPWRVWHFRIPWIQKMVTHHSVIPTRDSFQLWDVSGDAAVQIHVERVNDWPLRVPGM